MNLSVTRPRSNLLMSSSHSRRPTSLSPSSKKEDGHPIKPDNSFGSDDSSMGTAPTWMLQSSSSLNVSKDNCSKNQQHRRSQNITSNTNPALPATKARAWQPQPDKIASLWSSHSTLPLGGKSDNTSCNASRNSPSNTKKKQKKSRRGIRFFLNLDLSSEVSSTKSKTKTLSSSSLSLSSRKKKHIPSPLSSTSSSTSLSNNDSHDFTPTLTGHDDEPTITENESSIWEQKLRQIESTQELRLKEKNGGATRFKDAPSGTYWQKVEEENLKPMPTRILATSKDTPDNKEEAVDGAVLEQKNPAKSVMLDCEQREDTPQARDHPLLEMIIEVPTNESNEEDGVSQMHEPASSLLPPKEATNTHSRPKKDEYVAPCLDMIIEVPVTLPTTTVVRERQSVSC